MTTPAPAAGGGAEPTPPDHGDAGQWHASGQGSAAMASNFGITSTGPEAHNTVINLPPEGLAAPADVSAPPGTNNLPEQHSKVFEGRDADLARLHAVMAGDTGVTTQVVRGLGGVGKSTLARHYVHQRRDAFNPIWWITAETPDTITTDLAALTARLNPYAQLSAMKAAQAAEWALTWLQAHTGWLLVLDNALNPQDIARVIGQLPTGHHLITSRRAAGWHHLAEPLELDTISPEAAVTVLHRITGRTGNEAVFSDLAAELGYLPLALEQAAAYIKHTNMPAERYLKHLRDRPARMFATPAGGSNPDRTVARVWKLTLDSITRRTPLAGDILRTLAWFASDDCPRELLYQLDEDELTVDEALGALNDYSMITLGETTVTTHHLVQAVARTPDPTDPHRTADAVETARHRATTVLRAALPKNPQTNVAGWPRWKVLLPHVQALITATDPAHDSTDTELILTRAAHYLIHQGQLARATQYRIRSLEAATRLHGEDHPRTLTSRNNLAGAYMSVGDMEPAIRLYEQTLADTVRVLGEEHSSTFISRNNLAYAYKSVGDLERALPLYERTLADRERLLGEDHPDTLVSRNNLGSAYKSVGDLKRAIPLYERTLADRERVLGHDHPDTLTSLNNLASATESVGDLERAIQLYEQTLADRERLLGEDHPDTFVSRSNLAGAYVAAGDVARGTELYQRTLAARERVLGERHPDTLISRNNLAYAYQLAEDLGQAIPLYERTLAAREQVLGPHHPDTLTSRNNLGSAYKSAGDLKRAIALHEQTLADRERVLGPQHPSTLISRNNLASAYKAAGDLKRAIPLHEQTLADREQLLGDLHPDTLTSRNNLANSYKAAGDLDRALPLYERTLADSVRILGERHSLTRTLRINLAAARKIARPPDPPPPAPASP